MKVIIAGNRAFADYDFFLKNLLGQLSPEMVNEVVSGCCDNGVLTFTRPDGTRIYGADGLGERWAAENGIAVKPFPAAWSKHGLSAGPIRNGEMAKYLDPSKDMAIVFHDGKGKGSADMLKKARARGINTKYVAIA